MTATVSTTHQSSIERTKLIRASLTRRNMSEKIFRGLGLAAVVLALGFVALLFIDVGRKGIPAFTQSNLHLSVTFDPELIGVEPPPVQAAGQSDADFQAADLKWQRSVAMLNWNKVVEASLRTLVPAGVEISSKDLLAIAETDARHEIRERFVADPSLMGKTIEMDVLASANAANWIKGNIDRSLPDSQQQLSAPARAVIDSMVASGAISNGFAWSILTNVDSRSAPASAGLLGAFVGTLYMMLIVIVLAVPIGVASAIYLEEFAPKSRLTDFIEVNINNLAAVPSIVFGLLGLAVFINFMGLPRSASLVGGLVLTLMTLPTIIIATRAALKAVPPSIRAAALGLGASKMQMVFHHVLPLAAPGILTGTIIGLAQALGETAPLLLIGMVAFVADYPTSPMEPATALPVQIYMWANEAERAFVERTSGAIIILLLFLLVMNVGAILLRRRFERRW